MIALSKRFGFEVLRTTSGYYEDPLEPTFVMELGLQSSDESRLR
jgi:hypothetical protein